MVDDAREPGVTLDMSWRVSAVRVEWVDTPSVDDLLCRGELSPLDDSSPPGRASETSKR